MQFRLIYVAVMLGVYLLGAAGCSTGTNSYSLAQPAVNQAMSAPRTEVDSTAGPTAVVKSTRANLRNKPSRSGKTVTTLEKGRRLGLVDKARVGQWYQVKESRTGDSGWIHGNTITLVQEKIETPDVFKVQGSASASRLRSSPSGSGRSYINVDGARVRSPVFSDSAPPGASARRRDGSYSFSRNRRGTCSHHGGVDRWL